MLFDSVDILSGKTAEELNAFSKQLQQDNIIAKVKPFKEKGIFLRSKWLRTPTDRHGFMLSVKKRDLSKATYILNRFLK